MQRICPHQRTNKTTSAKENAHQPYAYDLRQTSYKSTSYNGHISRKNQQNDYYASDY